MKITFAYDKKAKQPHYQVRHGDIDESEFTEVFLRTAGGDWSTGAGFEGRGPNL
jgi:hypothetical protein